MKIFKNITSPVNSGVKKIKKIVVNPFFRFIRRFFSSPYRRAIFIIIPFLSLLFFLDYTVFLSAGDVNWISVIARVHGIFFDIIFLGFFLLIVEALRGRKRKIEKYREELRDIFFWNEKEGILKKSGIIRRLSALGAKVTKLSG